MVELDTAVKAGVLAEGDSVEGRLVDDFRYKNKIIPAGTKFSGHFQETEASKRYARPGFVQIKMDQIQLPSGETLSVSNSEIETRPLRHPDGMTMGQFIKRGIPLTATGAATSIPLNLATGLNGGVVAAISYGARSAFATTQEFLNMGSTTSDDHAAKKIWQGFYRASAVPAAQSFVSKSPNPSYETGDVMPLYLKRSAFNTLFKDVLPVHSTSTKAEILPHQTEEALEEE
ncbi:MAG: hypothetical protein SFZ03_11325 [Candidatus Melainabacteria bacterium]|nr:hypothetical protein [Candidatus Melainabacteria bacterium]